MPATPSWAFRSAPATSWPFGIFRRRPSARATSRSGSATLPVSGRFTAPPSPGPPAPATSAAPSARRPLGRISIRWRDGYSFSVDVGAGVDLSWDLKLAATPVTRLMSAVSGAVPERLWRSRTFLRAMGAVAGPVLGAGHLGLTGAAPNGQTFGARPRRMWFVRDSTAQLQGHSLGQDVGTARPGPARGILGPAARHLHDRLIRVRTGRLGRIGESPAPRHPGGNCITRLKGVSILAAQLAFLCWRPEDESRLRTPPRGLHELSRGHRLHFRSRPARSSLWSPSYRATLQRLVQRFFKKYSTFSGLASRGEYWWWALVSSSSALSSTSSDHRHDD